jgi:hypothetical protein
VHEGVVVDHWQGIGDRGGPWRFAIDVERIGPERVRALVQPAGIEQALMDAAPGHGRPLEVEGTGCAERHRGFGQVFREVDDSYETLAGLRMPAVGAGAVVAQPHQGKIGTRAVVPGQADPAVAVLRVGQAGAACIRCEFAHIDATGALGCEGFRGHVVISPCLGFVNAGSGLGRG